MIPIITAGAINSQGISIVGPHRYANVVGLTSMAELVTTVKGINGEIIIPETHEAMSKAINASGVNPMLAGVTVRASVVMGIIIYIPHRLRKATKDIKPRPTK